MSQAECLITPLGGLGEIGKNMLALECQDQIVIIDAGLAFPSEDQPGVDFIIPDISYLLERREQVKAIVLTHGHEDHVGGLPYLLRQLPVPVYGSRMALGIVANKLEEHPNLPPLQLKPVAAGEDVTVGPFRIEFIRVTHSIVDGFGLGIATPAGNIVHTGDFKLDPTPVDGCLTDLARFGAWGQQGVDLLLSDSTNAERPGYTLSEREVGQAFDEIIRDAQGRVVIACFSSNVTRFQQALEAAARYQRKVGVLGLSMTKNLRTANELGYLDLPPNLWLRATDISRLPPEKTLVLTTGSQGEPRSALARAAVGENNDLQFKAGDTVIISARTIPGNERRIGNMINHLFRLGCQVHYERVSEIHVSGHAAQEELKVMLNLVRPRHFIPVHGELRHLVRHAALAREVGIAPDRILVLENGQQVALASGGVRRTTEVAAGNVFVDGKGLGDVDRVVLRDRQHLAQDGMVIAIVGVDRHSGELVAGPDLVARGIADETETGRLTQAAEAMLRSLLEREARAGRADTQVLQDILRTELKRFFKKESMRFPMIIPVVVET